MRWGLLANALLITANAISRKFFSVAWANAFDMQWHTRMTHQTGDEQHPTRAVHRRLLGLASALIAFALDQITKAAALAGLFAVYRSPLPFLDFVLMHNRGISFGVLGGAGWPPWVLASLSLVLAALLIVWLIRATVRTTSIALGLVIGGALGNIADRIRHGAVTDFIDLHAGDWHWPAFNLADAAIFSGAAVLVLASFQRSEA